MTETQIPTNREAQRFMESLGSSETTKFGHYGTIRKFGSSGHVCIRSDFPGSSTEWLILSAGDVEALSSLFSEVLQKWEPIKAQKAVDEKKRSDNTAANTVKPANGK